MLAEFLEEENLQDGLNDYLNTYKYGNADIKDLWNVFSRNTNHSVDVKVGYQKFLLVLHFRTVF